MQSLLCQIEKDENWKFPSFWKVIMNNRGFFKLFKKNIWHNPLKQVERQNKLKCEACNQGAQSASSLPK